MRESERGGGGGGGVEVGEGERGREVLKQERSRWKENGGHTFCNRA